MGKKILEFFGLIGCALGFVGALCVCLLCGDYWPIAIGVIVLGVAAFPRFLSWWKDLNEIRKSDE